MTAVVYATASELRTELGVNNTVLPDAAAEKLILEAEGFTDGLLGGWPIDETTGRKIEQSDVEAWQWAKLKRAVLLLAVELYASPDVLRRARYRREKGPDFEFEDPLGGGVLSRYMAVLNDSGLRMLGGRATHGRCAPARQRYRDFFQFERG